MCLLSSRQYSGNLELSTSVNKDVLLSWSGEVDNNHTELIK